MKNQRGQVILILLLVMTVGLAIGLSVVQRSITDISTATKVEESSRAFSAAEAGIEKALRGDSNPVTFSETGASAAISDSGLLPLAGQPLEYPLISKEEVAQVWLADPQTLNQYYNQPYLEIAWGATNIQNPDEYPAIEVVVIYFAGGLYQSKKFYFDSNSLRASLNGFQNISDNCSNSPAVFSTSMGQNRVFYCRNSLSLSGITPTLMLLRARILYSNVSQPFAVLPWGGNCGTNACSLPPQARMITSTGIAGATSRQVQVFRLERVVPPYFDYAIFSLGEIQK